MLNMLKMLKNRYYLIPAVFAGVALIVTMPGCLGAATTGFKVTRNLMKGGSNLRITLDGQEAKQNTLKKAIAGHSSWKIKEPVSTSPKLAFHFKKPEKVGRITYTVVNIFQKFEADYSDQAEFTIVPVDNSAESLLRPGTEYDLGSLPPYLKITDVRGNTVETVKLIPGVKYMLQLSIKADDSETASVYFETN